MSDKEKVMQVVQEMEAMAKKDPMYRTNPFVRPGCTAQEVAYALRWWKTGPDGRVLLTRSGRKRVDTWRAKRVLEELVADGRLVRLRPSRTLSAGSRHVMTYATQQFSKWLRGEDPM